MADFLTRRHPQFLGDLFRLILLLFIESPITNGSKFVEISDAKARNTNRMIRYIGPTDCKQTCAERCFVVWSFRQRSLKQFEKFVDQNRKVSKMSRLSMAKLGYLIAAGASFLLSIWLWFNGSKEQGAFVGLWVPSILAFGALMLSGGSNE